MSIRRHQTGTGESTTRTFSIIIAGLAHAGLRPQEFSVVSLGRCEHDEGVSIHALSIPREVLNCVSELRKLDLYLETNDDLFKNPKTWQTHTSTFLSRCPHLRHLRLAFRDWKHTERVFASVAQKVVLPKLEVLILDNIRCAGADLRQFLEAHPGLRSLRLENLDVTGSITFADTLSVLEVKHDRLVDFRCDQIAQNSFRLFFDTLGKLDECTDWHYRLEDNQEALDFWADFVSVLEPFKYIGIAEAWEGVQQKIGLLRDDIRVSTRDYHPDYPLGGYWWYV
ncbi:hypothetical protein LTR65_007711 [Meristemomyces frigidus]